MRQSKFLPHTGFRPRPWAIPQPGSRLGPTGRWAIGWILALMGAQLVFLTVGCDWELCGDEAEYWAWSRRLDWAYYAKGPLIALVIRLSTALTGGLSLALTGDLMPAVRLPAVLLGGLTAWGVFRLASETARSERAGLIAVLILPAVPVFRIGALLMTIDTPLVCCWTWAAVWSYRAIVRDDSRAWLAAGLLGALGVLAKYTMLAFPASVGLFLLLGPARRRHLLRPGFWIMSATCALGLAPIYAWNVRHDWVGAGQLADRVGLTSEYGWRGVLPLLSFLGGEVLVLGIWWSLGVLAIVRAMTLIARPDDAASITSGDKRITRHGRDDREGLLFLICLWFVVWSACVAAGLAGENEANWAVPGYVAVMALIGWWLDRRYNRAVAWTRGAWACVAIWGLAMTCLTAVQHTEWFYPLVTRLVPAPTEAKPAPLAKLDPTSRMRGFRELAPEVDRLLGALRAGGLDPIILAPNYAMATALSFYLPGRPEVYPLNWSSKGPRYPANQHDLWRPNPRLDPETFQGRSAIVVQYSGSRPNLVGTLITNGWFHSEGPTSHVVARRHGLPVAAWDVTITLFYLGNPELRANVPR